MKHTWLMPDYYRRFSCKIDKCRHTCCSSWLIPVSRKEYLALITMDRSEDLDHKIQNAFMVPEQPDDLVYRYIAFNWLGNCPIQDRGLCSLHREKGEAFLPKVCRLYPRSLKRINDTYVACCSSSCERVVELLYEDEDLHIIREEMDEEAQILCEMTEEEIAEIVTIQRIIREKQGSLAEKIAEVCRHINKQEFTKDYSSSEDPLESILQLLQRFRNSDDQLSMIIAEVTERYTQKRDLYEEDRAVFEKRYPKWMSFFERVIHNSLIYENYPFTDKKTDKTGVYKGLCLAYGILRVLSIGYTAEHAETEDLIDTVSAVFRLIDHTSFYYHVSIISDNAAISLRL